MLGGSRATVGFGFGVQGLGFWGYLCINNWGVELGHAACGVESI